MKERFWEEIAQAWSIGGLQDADQRARESGARAVAVLTHGSLP